MTIAAGFVCSDGILLASDTLYSGLTKRYGPKFWVFDHGDPLVVFGGSGLEAGLTRATLEIERKLKPGQSFQNILDTIDQALEKVNKKLENVPDHDRTYALVVIRAHGKSQLFETASGGPMLSPVAQPSQCVGYAASLGLYFAQSLFREGMSMRWAKSVAAYMVENCKEYSGFCDGETHLLEIPSVGPPIWTTADDDVRPFADHLAVAGEAFRAVLPDGKADDDTLEYRVGKLKEAIDFWKKSIVLKAEAGHFSITGAAPTVIESPYRKD